jgi:hypothetical protein
MNIFSWLLVGHLVGDWLLQNDWMARGKKTGLVTAPGMTHFAIYTVSLLVTLWLAVYQLNYPAFYFLGAGLIIFISHWFIDATRIVEWWILFFGQTNNTMMRVMVDQTLHFLILVMVAVIFVGW